MKLIWDSNSVFGYILSHKWNNNLFIFQCVIQGVKMQWELHYVETIYTEIYMWCQYFK